MFVYTMSTMTLDQEDAGERPIENHESLPVKDVKVQLASLIIDGIITPGNANEIAKRFGIGDLYDINEVRIVVRASILSAPGEDVTAHKQHLISRLERSSIWTFPFKVLQVVEDEEPF